MTLKMGVTVTICVCSPEVAAVSAEAGRRSRDPALPWKMWVSRDNSYSGEFFKEKSMGNGKGKEEEHLRETRQIFPKITGIFPVNTLHL